MASICLKNARVPELSDNAAVRKWRIAALLVLAPNEGRFSNPKRYSIMEWKITYALKGVAMIWERLFY